MNFRFERGDQEVPRVWVVADPSLLGFRFQDPKHGEQETGTIELSALTWKDYSDAAHGDFVSIETHYLERTEADPHTVHIVACLGYASVELADSPEPVRLEVRQFTQIPRFVETA